MIATQAPLEVRHLPSVVLKEMVLQRIPSEARSLSEARPWPSIGDYGFEKA